VCIKQFLEGEGHLEECHMEAQKDILGFTFSFPVEQTSIHSGKLIAWTKGFSVKGVEGKDVVQLLNDAFKQEKVSMEVSALANDTVGTMMTRSYTDPFCNVGVILGTGTNACYTETVKNIKKLEGHGNPDDSMIINIEWGAFGDDKNFLKFSDIDVEIDENSINPGRQRFEKLISGMYLGEIVRKIVVKLHKHDELFVGSLGKFETDDSFKSSLVSRVEKDDSEDLTDIEIVLKEHGVDSTIPEREIFKDICTTVTTRAARLAATAILAVVTKIGKMDKCTVAVD